MPTLPRLVLLTNVAIREFRAKCLICQVNILVPCRGGLRPGRLARKLTRKGVPAGRATSTSLGHIAGVLTNKYPFRRDLFVRKPYKVMSTRRWPPPREMEAPGQVLSSWKGHIRDIMRHICHGSQTA